MNAEQKLLRLEWHRVWNETCTWHTPDGVAVLGVEYLHDMNRELNGLTRTPE